MLIYLCSCKICSDFVLIVGIGMKGSSERERERRKITFFFVIKMFFLFFIFTFKLFQFTNLSNNPRFIIVLSSNSYIHQIPNYKRNWKRPTGLSYSEERFQHFLMVAAHCKFKIIVLIYFISIRIKVTVVN